MSAADVILWRHGQTDYNAAGRLQGQIDIPLNPVGIAQAQEAASVLAQIKPAAIITSDLSRAADTAEVLAGLINADVVVDERLRERSFGAWEGLTRDEINDGWPQAFAQWRSGAHPDGVNAETRGDLGDRFAQCVNEWTARFEMSDTLVFVAHGAAIATGIASLLNQDPEEWRGISGISNCHWSILEPYSGEPGWQLTRHNVGP